MKSNKSYTCIISGNEVKINYIESNLKIIEDLSWYIFNLKVKFGIHWWFNSKKLYHQCRRMFPEINSKVLQNFIRYFYTFKKDSTLPKKYVKPSVILDYQNFKIGSSDKTKLTNFWLKFHRIFFPLFGKKILRKLNLKKIKLIKIYKRNNKLYCVLTEITDLVNNKSENTDTSQNIVGCDVNYKRVVFSDNKFNHIKKLAHRKIEHKKNNLRKRSLTNYSKDYLHKLTTQIVKDFLIKGIDVLVLEDLTNLNKKALKKSEHNKGKMINYIINSFPYRTIQDFLKYKCLDQGIKVEFVNPAYTSKTCSKCGSLETERPRQEDFVCLSCGFRLNADLNGSRNIKKRYTELNGLTMNPTLGKT